jgi:uncharacterized membrane protein
MTAWLWILAASGIAFATKLAGYLAPDSLLDSPAVRRATASVTVGLLASLVVTNTFSSGQSLVLDARVAALVAAAVALRLRAPFLLVVIVGAVAAALARVAGMA